MRSRTVLITGALALIGATNGTLSVWGQGTVSFSNRVGSVVDARVTFVDGTPLDGAFGFTAQLWGGPSGTPVQQLQPLEPTTTFRGGIAAGYVNPVLVALPGVFAEQEATFVMRVYNGTGWSDSTCRGESNPVTVTLSEGGPPPPNLVGLQPFAVNCIPEPTAFVLLVGSGALAAAGAMRSKRKERTTRITVIG